MADIDYSKIPTPDLRALKEGKLKDVSTETLLYLKSIGGGQQQQAQKGYFGGLQESLVKRATNIQQELTPTANEAWKGNSYSLGETLKRSPERALRITGQTAGLMGDVIGETVSAVTPDFIKEGASAAALKILDTPLGKAGLSAAKRNYAEYQLFKKSHPDAAKDSN